MIEIDAAEERVFSVLLAEDDKQVWSGGVEGALRRWRVDDGQEVGEPIQTEAGQVIASALSPDRKWLVCGLWLPDPNALSRGMTCARVYDAQTHKQVLDIDAHMGSVFSVDISYDSTKFTTSGGDHVVFIWSMTTGQQLVGPLEHDGWVMSVRFSPTGDRVATVSKSIRIYNSNNGQQLLDIPSPVHILESIPLAWSADGRQLFTTSYSEVRRFDTSSGSLLCKWSVPGGGTRASIVLSRNQKFAVVTASRSLSFWDTSTDKQIGTAVDHSGDIYSIALSTKDDCIAIGQGDGKLILRSLHDILPGSYLTVNEIYNDVSTPIVFPTFLSQLPLMDINEAAFKSWKQGDLTRAEEFLTEEIAHPVHHGRALAQRALVRGRLKQSDMAMNDAKKSIEAQRSVIGYIANAVTRIGNGDYESTIRAFDLAFTDGLATDNNFLLLIKAIILFECGKHHDAISRVDDLIDIVDDKPLYITVRAQMSLLLRDMLLRQGDSERAVELLRRARDALPFQTSPNLLVISLIFGWDFDKLHSAIRLQLQECIEPIEARGDAAVQSENLEDAILQYSTALSLNPLEPAALLVKRSKVRAMVGMWENALKDADEAITADSQSPRGYERSYAALHALRRYGEAVDSFTRMHTLIEESSDQEIRQLGEKYVSPSRWETVVSNAIKGVSKISPLVLIDVKSGRLCDEQQRKDTLMSEDQFKELRSSMTEELDNERIQQVVEGYFQYVTLSHVWQGKEPSFQNVTRAQSVWDLDSSPLNEKLRNFCEVVRTDGYRWAWSDTCCIDKTISTVLNQSLKMMYKWYEASAATFVLLVDVESSAALADVGSTSALRDLTDSKWMTRAWTAQELLAAKVIRFYDRNWKPYLGDTRSNHKESPEIMQELADAIGVSHQTIIAFNPDDLTVREKLRLASTRNAAVEEDVAYSLIGIFKSDIKPYYGEGDAALGQLLEEIVARSGEVTVLAWTGKSSPYNSCLPATLEVYSQPPGTSPATNDAEMDMRVATLRNSLSQRDASLIYDRVTHLPPARFSNRRLYLPCIIFAVKKLGVHSFGDGLEHRYRARVSAIGDVEFQTLDLLSPTEPRKLIFVHPWIRDLYDPIDAFDLGSTGTLDDAEDESDSDSEFESAPSSPLHAVTVPAATVDSYTHALRLVARLQHPFHALLLQKQSNGEFRRVAAEHDIVVPGIDRRINFTKDIHTEVVEIL